MNTSSSAVVVVVVYRDKRLWTNKTRERPITVTHRPAFVVFDQQSQQPSTLIPLFTFARGVSNGVRHLSNVSLERQKICLSDVIVCQRLMSFLVKETA